MLVYMLMLMLLFRDAAAKSAHDLIIRYALRHYAATSPLLLLCHVFFATPVCAATPMPR